MTREKTVFFLACFLLVFLWYRIAVLHEKAVNIDSAKTKTGQEKEIAVEDQYLFNSLLKERIITPGPDGICLEMPARDQHIVYNAAIQNQADITVTAKRSLEKKRSLIEALFCTPAGYQVQNQIRLWNQSHLLAAVRDNRNQTAGTWKNFWQAVDEKKGRSLLQTGGYVPEYYGFIHNGRLKPGFSNWLTVSADPHVPVKFSTVIQLEEPAGVTVQGIGKLVSAKPDAARVYFSQRGKEKTLEQSLAFELDYSLPAGKHEITLMISPVMNHEPSVPGLHICQSGTDDHFKWQNFKPSMPAFHTSYTISSSDGIDLVTESGTPTVFSKKHGLVPIVGFSRQDTFSLTGIMAKSLVPSDVTDINLTIDSRLQKKAQAVLEKKMADFFPEKTDPYTGVRKGAVVLMNAETGAILAAAGIPVPPENTHPWDLVSFAKAYPLENPMVVRAWKGLDKHNAPGSSFKPVVALAGLDMMEKEKSVKKFIKGYSKKELSQKNNASGLFDYSAVYQPLTGKSYSPRRIPANLTSKIDNFNQEPLSKSIDKIVESGCPDDKDHHRGVMGLDQAVRDSVNIWFARLAVIMDGDRARQYDDQMKKRKKGDLRPEFPEFQLSKMADFLGFGDSPIDLAVNLPDDLVLNRSLYKRKFWQGDVLYAIPGSMTLMDQNEGGFLWILAQNAIGQGVEVSPLQIAKVAASISSGRMIQPYLFHGINQDVLDPPKKKKEVLLNSRKLNLLKHAMKKVPTEGTARTAFSNHPDRCRIYGKTGTANVAVVEGGTTRTQKTFFTTWFMGWKEPETDEEPPIAFACMVTHAHGHYYTGGRVCAPIMAEILRTIELIP